MDGDPDKLVRFYKRMRGKFRRRMRYLFPSEAELRFIEIMGGRVVRFTKIKNPRRHAVLAFVITLGPIMRRQHVKREVRYGKYWVDFANDLHRIIEVDGAAWHMDVVADMDREINIKSRQREARILRIKAYEVFNAPGKVQQKVLKHLD